MHFISLQYGDTADERARFAERYCLNLVCWQDAVEDMDDAAALIAALDLVVSVCTAAIHLAGALGRPTWVLVPACPEWRYQAQGERMPWYPSVRLFRQRNANAWAPVMEQVAENLRQLSMTAEPSAT